VIGPCPYHPPPAIHPFTYTEGGRMTVKVELSDGGRRGLQLSGSSVRYDGRGEGGRDSFRDFSFAAFQGDDVQVVSRYPCP
jgi:hypothetical protein